MVAILQIDLQTKELVPTQSLLCFRENLTTVQHHSLGTGIRPKSNTAAISGATESGRVKILKFDTIFHIQRHMELLNTCKLYIYNNSNCHLRDFLIF